MAVTCDSALRPGTTVSPAASAGRNACVQVKAARSEYRAASQLAPEVLDLPRRHAATLAAIGREAEAVPLQTAVFTKESRGPALH